jgi:hypothetical protein
MLLTFAFLTLSSVVVAQTADRTDALVAAVRPALPFPDASADGELPASGGEKARWFVLWPAQTGEPRIRIKANPLHPETQASSVAAMEDIQQAVIAAERKAQAAYERAVTEVKRSGKTTDVDGVTLEDEGVAGERIDAELELTISLAPASSFDLASSRAPTVIRGTGGIAWVISTSPNVYRESAGTTLRERFRPAEVRLLIGVSQPPVVQRSGGDDRFVVTLAAPADALAVVLRGNEELLQDVVGRADWSRLALKTP